MGLLGGSESDITVKISADTKDATTKVAGLGTSFKTLTASFVAGNVITGALSKGFGLLEGVIGDSIKAWEDSEKKVAQLNATLESTHHAAGKSAQELIDLSQELEHMTTFSDEAVLSVENLLLTFTNITGNTFPEATRAVLDMATALGEDTSSAAIQLGKALNDPIQGVNALARVGVNFSGAQKEVIATMVKTGDTIGAQKLILAELSKEFGGSAVAQAKTFGGQIEQLKNQIDDLEEGIGHGLTAGLNNVFIAFNQATAGMHGTADMGKITFKIFSAVTEAAANTATGIQWLAGKLVNLGSYAAEAIALATGGGKKAMDFWKDFRDSTNAGISTTANFAMNLHNENQKTLAQWDNLNTDAKKYTTAGPAAYQATAQAAADAQKKIEEANKAIADTVKKIADVTQAYKESTAGNAKSEAEAYVAQQQKIKDLKKQVSDETDPDKKNELEKTLKQEQKALDKYKTYAKDNAIEIKEATRRANETQFERDMEDIQAKQEAETAAFTKTLAENAKQLAADTAKRDGIIGNAITTATVVTAAAQATTASIQAETTKQVTAINKVAAATKSAYGVNSIPYASAGLNMSVAPMKTSTPATMNFNFNGTTVGDAGIKKLFTDFLGGINRSSTLKNFAGL